MLKTTKTKTPGASTQAKTTPNTTPAVVSQTTEAAAPPAENQLTSFQNMLCEAASDLIFNGGKASDVHDFLKSLISHGVHREYPGYDGEIGIDRKYEDWRREFGRLIPKAPVGVAHPKPAPKSVSDAVRSNLRYLVARDLDEFVRGATVEELYFMREVLTTRQTTVFNGLDEIYLATACSMELGRESRYFVIPEELFSAFSQFRSVIEQAKAKAQAA